MSALPGLLQEPLGAAAAQDPRRAAARALGIIARAAERRVDGLAAVGIERHGVDRRSRTRAIGLAIAREGPASPARRGDDIRRDRGTGGDGKADPEPGKPPVP